MRAPAPVLAACLALFWALTQACAPSPEERAPARPSSPVGGRVPAAEGHSPPRHGRIRVVQIFVLEGRYPWEIQRTLRAAREAGADVVALRAFQLEGDRPHGYAPEDGQEEGVYFRTATSPVVADLLPVFAQAAHAEGLEAWAWMTTLGSRWLVDDDTAGWRADPRTGRMERTVNLDPFHPAAEEVLEAMYRDLGRSGVDGVLFQDDLALRQGEGFGPHGVEAYRSDSAEEARPDLFYEEVRTGKGGRPVVGRYTEAYRRWTRWRSGRLLDLAGRLAAAFRSGAARPVTVAYNVYYDELWTPDGALLWLSRDLHAALERRFDRYVIMAYHRQIGEETGRSGEELWSGIGRMARDLAAEDLAPDRAVVKLQTVDWHTGEQIHPNELEQAARPWLAVAPFSLGLAPWSPGTTPDFSDLGVPPAGEEGFR